MYKSFDTYIPTKILFGRGRVRDLGREVAALGKRALMVTVPWDDVQAEQFRRIQRILEDSGVEDRVARDQVQCYFQCQDRIQILHFRPGDLPARICCGP